MKQETPRIYLPGELFTLLGMLLNSLAVTLFIKADFGISAVSAVPYVLHLAFPGLSLGTWNAMMQSLWLLFTMAALRKIKPGYLLSFVLAFAFGLILDFWTGLVQPLPDLFAWRVAYAVLGYLLMAAGIGAFFVCGTPVLPFDTVARAFVMEKGTSAHKARTLFDLSNLALTILIGLVFLGRLVGIGFVTVFNAFSMGYAAGRVIKFLRDRYDIKPWFEGLSKLI